MGCSLALLSNDIHLQADIDQQSGTLHAGRCAGSHIVMRSRPCFEGAKIRPHSSVYWSLLAYGLNLFIQHSCRGEGLQDRVLLCLLVLACLWLEFIYSTLLQRRRTTRPRTPLFTGPCLLMA